MRWENLLSLASASIEWIRAQGQEFSCNYIPGDTAWPKGETWDSLNSTIGGRLIKSSALAEPCYRGPHQNREQCDYVNKMWRDPDFETSQPLGRWYPYSMGCPPIKFGAKDISDCKLGQSPVYSVNVTQREDIREALKFARSNRIRTSIVNTGHDLNGRSDGFGSLAIWMPNFQNGIHFQSQFESATLCRESGWEGGAIYINGSYPWRAVNEVAKSHKVIVVNGGSASVGATGGWLSGGGLGPAARHYGMGADQLLEADVMLANGSVVIANHCRNTDLFRALRGGGPGYGIVLSTPKSKLTPTTRW